MNLYSIILIISNFVLSSAMFEGQPFPPGCNQHLAQICEDELLQCQLFSGPSNDPKVQCACATDFFGSCIRQAGCETDRQVGALTKHEIYMKVCVDTIRQYNCSDTTICSINCASETHIDRSTSKIIPFNNYGEYYLRLKICLQKPSKSNFNRYRNVIPGLCKQEEDFNICTRWIPPLAFVPVAIPINTTFVEIDSCNYLNGVYSCPKTNPQSARVYGNQVIFPRSYDVAQSAVSICSTDDDCLGSFCDYTFDPPVCSPKSLRHVDSSGVNYFADPFG